MRPAVPNALGQAYESVIRHWGGSLGRWLRARYYRGKFAGCGTNLVIDEGVYLAGTEHMTLGSNVWIDKGCVIIAGPPSEEGQRGTRERAPRPGVETELGQLTIGDDCHFGVGTIIQAHGGVVLGSQMTTSSGVKLYSWSNDARRARAGTFGPGPHAYVRSPIVVENNVWLGLDVVVLGGRLGRDSFVAPKSVVVNSFEPNSWMSGNPAARTGPRFPDAAVP